MSHASYLNMELIMLDAIEHHINLMHDDLMDPSFTGFIHPDLAIHNIKHGFVAVTMLSTYFDSFLNHVIEGILKYEGERLLRFNTEDKIEILYIFFNKENTLKGNHFWGTYKKVIRVRNELVHFKKRYIGSSTGFPHIEIKGERLLELFKRSNMLGVLSDFKELTKKIADDFGLKINDNAPFVHCSGVGDPDYTDVYVYDPLKPNHDKD